MKTIPAILIVVLLALGCSRQTEPASPAPSPAASPAPEPRLGLEQPLLPASSGNPADVLVEVDGAKLVRAEADIEVEYKLAAQRQPIPPEYLPRVRGEMLSRIVEQFIAKTVLLKESDNRKISISKEEEEEAYNNVKAQLPPGKTLDDVLKNSPLGEKRMREEFMTGLKINRLLGSIFTNQVAVTDQEVTNFYANIRQARHILIKTDRADDAQTKAEKKKKAEDIRKQVADGADFAEMAKQHSDCPSKQRGGDLGPFPKGQMDPVFEKAAFTQKPGDLGPVIETRFGYHIIQVMELDKEKAMPQDRLRKYLAQEKTGKAIDVLVRELKSKAQIKYGADFAPPAPAMLPTPPSPAPASVTTPPPPVGPPPAPADTNTSQGATPR